MEKMKLLVIGMIVLAGSAYAQCVEDEIYSSSDCLNEQLENNPESVNFDKVSDSTMKEIDDPNRLPEDVLEKRMNQLDDDQIQKLDKETLDDIDVKTFNDDPEIMESLTDDQLNDLPKETVEGLTPVTLSQGTPTVASRLGIPVSGSVHSGCAAKQSGAKYILNCGGGDLDLTSEFEFGEDGTITVHEGFTTTTFTGSGDLTQDENGISGEGDWSVVKDNGGVISSISGSGTFTMQNNGQIEVDGDEPWEITIPDGMGNPVTFQGTGTLSPGGGGTIEGLGDWKMEDPSNPGQFIDMKDSNFHYTDYGLSIISATIDGKEVEDNFRFTDEGKELFMQLVDDPDILTDGEFDPDKILEKYGDVGFMFLAEEGSYMHCIVQMALDNAYQAIADGMSEFELPDEPHILDTTGLDPDESRTLMDDNPQLSQLYELMLNDPELLSEDGTFDVDYVMSKAVDEYGVMTPLQIAVLRATMNNIEYENSVPDDAPDDVYIEDDTGDVYDSDTGYLIHEWDSPSPDTEEDTGDTIEPNTEAPTPDVTSDDTWKNLLDNDGDLTAELLYYGKDSKSPPKISNYNRGLLYYNFEDLGATNTVAFTLKTGKPGDKGDSAEFVIPGQFETHMATMYGSSIDGGEVVTTLEVASDPITFALKVLEKVFMDFDGNGIDDFAIKLLSIESMLISTFEFTLITPRKLLENEGLSTFGKISEFEDDYGNEITEGENVFISKTISGSHADKLEDMNGAVFEDVDNFTVYADGTVVDKAQMATDAGGNSYQDVSELEYLVRDDITTVKFTNASQITLDDGAVIEDVTNGELEFDTLTGDLLSVSLESSVDDNTFSIGSPEGMEIEISDLDKGEAIAWDSRDVEFAIRVRGSVKAGFIPIADFKSNGLFGEIMFEEFEDHIFYRFRNGNLSIPDLDIGYDEFISTNSILGYSTVEVYYDYGVRCQNLTKDAMYEYRHDQRNKSFAVYSNNQYKFCLRKKSNQNPYDMFDNLLAMDIGYADLVESMYYLSSEVEYLEPYKGHYELKEIYVGQDMSNKMMFSKSSNLFNIENMSVQNYAPEKGALSQIYTGYFNIVETFLFDKLQRYLSVDKNYPNVVQRYASYYHPSFIIIENRTLMQESINKEGSVTKVTVFSPHMQDDFVEEVIIKSKEDNFFSKLFGGFK